ncbi:helix-turn-helix transcriptional regulator [Baekduia sp. Peel2402]|uniref:helix-turn-helix transcriptional regulator n=1 Tax=Baekduia sp. Peel2402 TaxID=3458296 RepID=UPI00403EA91C
MDGLRERDLQNLLEILGEVHHAEDVPSFRAALLDVVPRVIPNAYTSYNEFGADGTPLVAIVTPMPEQRLLENWARFGHQSPLVERYLRTRDPRAYRLSDVIAQAEFQQRDLYREVFAPLGVEHQLVVTLPAPPTLLIGLALADARDFTDGERRVLDLARPHLIQAHANAALRERLRDVLAAVEAGLDDGGDAVVVIDARGRVALATRAGRASLRALGASRSPDAGLPAPLADLLAARKAPTHALLARADGAEPIVVRRLSRAAGGATVVVFERSGRAASRELLEALGLSPREAEVLQLMMRGQTTAAIATDLQVSPRTVSKHAERIYDKLGVHDRVAAVSAAWSALDSGRTALSA